MAMNGGGSAAYVEGWPVARASRTDVSTAAVISWREAYGMQRFRIALSREGWGYAGASQGRVSTHRSLFRVRSCAL